MKEMKKVIAVLLVAVLSVGVLPLTAFAEELIPSVDITNVVAPVVGQKAQYSYDVTDSDKIFQQVLLWVEMDSAPTSFEDVNAVGNENGFIDGDYTFKADKYYVAYISFRLWAGYFYLSPVSVTVNGEAPTFIDRFSENGLTAYYCFGTPADDTVDVTGYATSFGDAVQTFIQLLPAATNEVAYETAILPRKTGNAFIGRWGITDVAPGDYILRVRKTGHVTHDYDITVGSTDVAKNVEICLIGDGNGDGYVNVTDYNLVVSTALSFDTSVTQSDTYSRKVIDTNADGFIDVLDCAYSERVMNGH